MTLRSTWLLLLLLCALSPGATAQIDTIDRRILLIGDAGELINGRAAVINAAKAIVPFDAKTSILYMGDNLYTAGLPDEQYSDYNDKKRVLDSEAAIARGTEASVYFMPGNHDWANDHPQGFESIIRQQIYVDQVGGKNVHFYPEDGCPGPVEVPLGDNTVLIIMDSQWWLNRRARPGIESDCPYKTEDEVLGQIKDIIDRNPHKLILFSCHHPFKSVGFHSGYYSIRQHIFPFTDINRNLYIPLPVLGSIYPISRGAFGSPQDRKFPAYDNMVTSVEKVLKTHPYVIRMHGHEHTLQYLVDSGRNYIISGAGSKMSRINHPPRVKYAARSLGFAVLEISTNRNVRLNFYEVPIKSAPKMAYSQNIMNFTRFASEVTDTATHKYVYQDSITVPVNAELAKATWFARLMIGENHRKEWGAPVRFKVFHINEEMPGYKVESLKGGKQSKSLHIRDKNGKTWVLRTVNKDVENVLPPNVRETFAQDIVSDILSASDPYGALGVPPLSEALGIAHASPRYFFVPDDPALGQYRAFFANSVCMLEEAAATVNDEKAISTQKMFNKLLDDNDHLVDQGKFLKARMLDFLIADFDRHFDQWKWGAIDTGKGKVYYPIPRDRDQAFFYSDGLLMKLATRTKLTYMQGFKYNMPKVKKMGYVARDLDRLYLNDLDANEWRRSLADLKRDLTDDVIATAASSFPPEISAMDSATFAAKLRSRRDLLPKKGMIYYRFLSRKVVVRGSNENEYFHVSKNDSGLNVTVYARKKSGALSFPMYSRQFDKHVTREIAMYGFNGNDVFKIDSNVGKGIKLVMIGGQGADTFDIHGKSLNYIYDLRSGGNVIKSRSHTRNMMSTAPEVNNFDERYNYNTHSFPRPRFGYNIEDKFLVGIGYYAKTYDFRKDPYSSEQSLNLLFSPANSAYQVGYNGIFNYIVHKYDLVLHGMYQHPTVTNFFGFGDDAVRDPGKPIEYYRVRYKFLSGDALLRKRFFFDNMSVAIGPTAYLYWNNNTSYNANRILARPEVVGLDSSSVYQSKAYVGGKIVVNINNVNDNIFPSRGVDWTTDFASMAGLDNNSKEYTRLISNMTIYSSLVDVRPVVMVTRLGAGHIFSKDFEYFQAMSLGANNILRGFLKNRFSGQSMAYISFEARVKLFDFRSYILPGEVGLIGFNDLGRVWMPNETSHSWHDAYGGGLYYLPFHMVMVSGTVAFSPEGTLFNIGIGTHINTTF
jgi:hypothetical protein